LVLDADSLINLNQAGNLAALASLNRPLGNGYPISHSNLGLSATEINPFWALVADPQNSAFLNPTNTAATPSTTLQQYRGFFNITTPSNYVPDRIEIANTDMLFLMWGRPSYSVTSPAPPTEVFTLNNLVTGLWGETSALLAGVNAFHAGNPNAPQMFP